MITSEYNKNGVRILMRRYDRLAELNRQLFMRTLKNLYPDSLYQGDDPDDIEFRDKLIKAFDQFSVIAAGMTTIQGLPYALPKPNDKVLTQTAFEHFMTDDGQELYNELAVKMDALLEPLAPKEQAPLASLTDSERNDPNSDGDVPTSQQQYVAVSEKPLIASS